MSYTSAEQVRCHLIVPYPIEDRVADQSVTLSGGDYVSFYGGAIEGSTVRVKSIKSQKPVRTTVSLSGGAAVVTGSMIVPGSLVAASDSSLGTVYVENIDYVVDYGGGVLTLKAGGVLDSNSKVTVWFFPYALYQEGSDYTLDSSGGRIKRLGSGSIADGETVRLDYNPVYVSVADEIVENAVAMANGLVETEVDPERQFEVNPTLSAAATYRALEIVCRAAATRELASQRAQDKAAVVWVRLADDYAGRSDLLLRSFRPPYSGPRTPARS